MSAAAATAMRGSRHREQQSLEHHRAAELQARPPRAPTASASAGRRRETTDCTPSAKTARSTPSRPETLSASSDEAAVTLLTALSITSGRPLRKLRLPKSLRETWAADELPHLGLQLGGVRVVETAGVDGDPGLQPAEEQRLLQTRGGQRVDVGAGACDRRLAGHGLDRRVGEAGFVDPVRVVGIDRLVDAGRPGRRPGRSRSRRRPRPPGPRPHRRTMRSRSGAVPPAGGHRTPTRSTPPERCRRRIGRATPSRCRWRGSSSAAGRRCPAAPPRSSAPMPPTPGRRDDRRAGLDPVGQPRDRLVRRREQIVLADRSREDRSGCRSGRVP